MGMLYFAWCLYVNSYSSDRVSVMQLQFHISFNSSDTFRYHYCKGCCYCLVAKLCPTLLWCHGLARQASLSMGFPRQEYWSGLSFPSPGSLPDWGIQHTSLATPELVGRFFTTEPPGKATILQFFFTKRDKYRFKHSISSYKSNKEWF